MANLSETLGTITLEGRWLKRDALILKRFFFGLYVAGEYNIRLVDLQETDTILKLIQHESVPFNGTGYWSMSNTLSKIKLLIYGLETSLENNMKNFFGKRTFTYNQYMESIEQLKHVMFERGLRITFNFFDIESGCNFLQEVAGDLQVIKVNEQLEFIFEESSVDNYDCNLKNYVNFMLESDDPYLDEIVSDIVKMSPNKPEYTQVKNLILKHNTWYDLPSFPSINLFEELPEELQTDILKLTEQAVQST